LDKQVFGLVADRFHEGSPKFSMVFIKDLYNEFGKQRDDKIDD
jgi:hypothetical protein